MLHIVHFQPEKKLSRQQKVRELADRWVRKEELKKLETKSSPVETMKNQYSR